VQLDAHGIAMFAKSGTGVAHCPCSNMRLASGIAPIRKMFDAGVKVGLGVDGSASNDKGHMLGEARQAMLLQRVGFGQSALNARQALELATRGGASVLGRDDIGYLAPGMSADFVAFRLDDMEMAGGLADPVASLIFCTPSKVNWSVINGRPVIREGNLSTIELTPLITRHNRLAKELLNSAR
jgi:cytosine/adenosine deaminase-related metal-dependent hydrolase